LSFGNFFSINFRRIFTETNLSNLLKQVSGIGIVSIGMLIVILTGGIDLSVVQSVALAVAFAILVNMVVLPLAILITIIMDLLLGFLWIFSSL
jgi:ribose transport system permease protein